MLKHTWFLHLQSLRVKKKSIIAILFFLLLVIASIAFKNDREENNYIQVYRDGLENFNNRQKQFLENLQASDLKSGDQRQKMIEQIHVLRSDLKRMDFWFRYLEPVSYKKINGPLPVEWETEVFEKFEKPYRREGAGLTLAELCLQEEQVSKDSVYHLVASSVQASRIYLQDSIAGQLRSFDHFYLCNRLFLLNLASIYTSGFECPEPSRIIPELRLMLSDVHSIYLSFNQSFPAKQLSAAYMDLYKETVSFINRQSDDPQQFDHFVFIRDYVNPLFTMNQSLIREHNAITKSYVDYSLNKSATSIFSKSLYKGQNVKGIFVRVYDIATLAEIERLGKLLFYDPILSGNNLRSCASCHKPEQFFTDTAVRSSLQFDGTHFLPRNSPSLVNAGYNHLIMMDGLHISLQDQARAVVSNSTEMACSEEEMLKKVLSCEEYKTGFKNLLKYTPQQQEISLEHIYSAITTYYSKFGKYNSSFDLAMNKSSELGKQEQKGFNVFMSKAQCATCHFAPQFNGVKPPYVSSEFEVLGVPKDTSFHDLSPDKGRYMVNPSEQTLNAFRTGTLRNIEKTKPYMHNGVFRDLESVIDFYDAGGGAGRGLEVPNQTLSSDSLHLTKEEKKDLVAFMRSLTETIEIEKAPALLPRSKIKTLNQRKVGGEY